MQLPTYKTLLFLSPIGLTCIFSSVVQAEELNKEETIRLIVKRCQEGGHRSLDEVFVDHGLVCESTISEIACAIVEVSASEADATIKELKENQEVEYVEKDARAELFVQTNDPYSSVNYQWHLQKLGLPTAWETTTGDEDLIVAVIDTGVNAYHPELQGLVLTELGYDFVNDSNDSSDQRGHGTAVAGSITANTNNGAGISGISWNTKILPLKVFPENDGASYIDIAEAVVYAVESGADIINLSLGGPSYSNSLNSVFQYAWEEGCVIIASAGNESNSVVNYPAGFGSVISVSATDKEDLLASFSSYGDTVEISAPGQSIVSLTSSGGYGYWSGTSFSAPVVSGVTALVMSAKRSLTNQEVKDILLNTSVDLGAAGKDGVYGHGRVNALAAVLAALENGSPTPDPIRIEPHFTITEVNVDSIRVHALIEPNQSYTIECSADLDHWDDAHTSVGSGAVQIYDIPLGENCRFFRLLQNDL